MYRVKSVRRVVGVGVCSTLTVILKYIAGDSRNRYRRKLDPRLLRRNDEAGIKKLTLVKTTYTLGRVLFTYMPLYMIHPTLPRI